MSSIVLLVLLVEIIYICFIIYSLGASPLYDPTKSSAYSQDQDHVAISIPGNMNFQELQLVDQQVSIYLYIYIYLLYIYLLIITYLLLYSYIHRIRI